MLKLKLQYFGHLMRTANSLEKSLMLAKTEARRRREHQRDEDKEVVVHLYNGILLGHKKE